MSRLILLCLLLALLGCVTKVYANIIQVPTRRSKYAQFVDRHKRLP
nr:venom peptide [Acharia stimulea]